MLRGAESLAQAACDKPRRSYGVPMPAGDDVRILLVSGSMRAGSSNAAVLRTAQAIAPAGVETRLYAHLAALPHFNPDHDFDPLPPAVIEMRTGIATADAVLFCTPEYAGAMPGSFKNLLDWTVGGGEIYGKPVAWINASGLAAPTGGAHAHASLRIVLGYTGAEIVEDACVRIPIARQMVGEDGLIGDPAVRSGIADALGAVVAHVRARRLADDSTEP
jgi:chromate reductase, NAD(P)H dehydrogenase (quinone)